MAGCEKEKNKEAEQTINESNYDIIPLEEYIIGTWISPYFLGGNEQQSGTLWIDTMNFADNLFYNSCNHLNRKYKCSNSNCDTIFVFTSENHFYPFRIKRIAADTLLVYETNYCHSITQESLDLRFIRSKENNSTSVQEETINVKQFVGTWVSCGLSYTDEDPDCDCLKENGTDTISFLSNNYMTDNFKFGLSNCKYELTSDTTILIQRDSDNWSNVFAFKFSNDGSNLIIYNWRHRDVANYVYHVCFKKIK